MQTVELTPSGTTTDENKPEKEVTKSGASVIREPKELFSNWTGQALNAALAVDEIETVANIEDAPSVDNQLLFGLIRDPRVRVVKPIPIEVRREGDGAIAFWAEAEEFGHGRDRSEAIEDFGRTVSQLFVSLSRNESQLGPDLQRLLALLRMHMILRKAG